MSGVRRFEELTAWQKARVLTKAIYLHSNQGSFARDFALRDQIRRSAVSIMSNIAEGFERFRPSELHQYLSIAKASCAELRSQLYVAYDVGHVEAGVFHQLLQQAEEVGRLLGGLRSAASRRQP
jgi:four helix bundle protein